MWIMPPNNYPVVLSERIGQGSLCAYARKRKNGQFQKNNTISPTKKELVKGIKATPYRPEQLHSNNISSS